MALAKGRTKGRGLWTALGYALPKQLVAAAQVSEARIDATSRYFEIVAEPLKQVTVSLSTHSARTRAPGVVSM